MTCCQVAMHIRPHGGYEFELSAQAEADLLGQTVRLTSCALSAPLPNAIPWAELSELAKVSPTMKRKLRRAINKGIRRQLKRMGKYIARLGKVGQGGLSPVSSGPERAHAWRAPRLKCASQPEGAGKVV